MDGFIKKMTDIASFIGDPRCKNEDIRVIHQRLTLLFLEEYVTPALMEYRIRKFRMLFHVIVSLINFIIGKMPFAHQI